MLPLDPDLVGVTNFLSLLFPLSLPVVDPFPSRSAVLGARLYGFNRNKTIVCGIRKHFHFLLQFAKKEHLA